MKRKRQVWLYPFVFFVLLLVITNGCKKRPDSTVTPTIHEQLSSSQIQLIEAAGIDTVSTIEDALFPDGRNISEWTSIFDSGYVFTFNKFQKSYSTSSSINKKDLFIGRMTEAGFLLVDDNLHNYQGQSSGLAYVYDSKKFDLPSIYPGAVCQQLLYGLDCSGMIKQMGFASNFNLILDGTVNYVQVSTWNAAFNNSPDFQGLEMRDLLALPASQFQAGDMIVATDVHIGMVFSNGNSLKIFNSLGRLEYPCSKNSNNSHGPVITNNIQDWLDATFGSNYHVLRTNLQGTSGVVTDIDGNVYHTVTIGTQEWMVENLKTTKLNDGTSIQFAPDYQVWNALNDVTPKYCWYNNDISNKNIYGALYNWYTVNTGKLAPTGWHIPTDAEWTVLFTSLGGEDFAGGRMKETGFSHWLSPNSGASNICGFSALPGGIREGGFNYQNIFTHIWSSSKYDFDRAWHIGLYYDHEFVARGYIFLWEGNSVRCIKD